MIYQSSLLSNGLKVQQTVRLPFLFIQEAMGFNFFFGGRVGRGCFLHFE
jgi:hypothetical protein